MLRTTSATSPPSHLMPEAAELTPTEDEGPSPSMGGILPSELLSRILNFVCEAQEVERGLTGTLTKRELGRCSLVCHYWASICRPYIFSRLELRSREDAEAFLALVRGSEDKKNSVFHYVEHLVLEEKLLAEKHSPWAYLPFLSEIPPVQVTLKFRAVSPEAVFTFLSVLPRTIPSSLLRCRNVEVSECRCESFADLAAFLGGLNAFMLVDATCRNVTWQDSEALIPSLPPLLVKKASRGIPYKGQILVKHCTDAWPFIWLFFTTHHRVLGTWKRHRVHYIDPQELTKLCNLVRFITQNCVGKRGTAGPNGSFTNCGEFRFELDDSKDDTDAILSIHCSRNADVNQLHCTPGYYISISPAGLVVGIRVEYHGKHIRFGTLSNAEIEAFAYPWETLDELAADFGPTLHCFHVRVRTFEASLKLVTPAIVPKMSRMQQAGKLRIMYQSMETRWDWRVYT